MTRTEAIIMAVLAAWTAISLTLGLVLAIVMIGDDVVRWAAAKYRAWNTADLDRHAARAIAVTCKRCRPWGQPGPCACTQDCGHGECEGGHHTTLSQFTPEQVAYLRAADKELSAPQVVWFKRWAGRKKVTR